MLDSNKEMDKILFHAQIDHSDKPSVSTKALGSCLRPSKVVTN